jgi:hypothetical protein
MIVIHLPFNIKMTNYNISIGARTWRRAWRPNKSIRYSAAGADSRLALTTRALI